jgi:hypothetical protein
MVIKCDILLQKNVVCFQIINLRGWLCDLDKVRNHVTSHDAVTGWRRSQFPSESRICPQRNMEIHQSVPKFVPAVTVTGCLYSSFSVCVSNSLSYHLSEWQDIDFMYSAWWRSKNMRSEVFVVRVHIVVFRVENEDDIYSEKLVTMHKTTRCHSPWDYNLKWRSNLIYSLFQGSATVWPRVAGCPQKCFRVPARTFT